ncbi:MAG: hypothetical protein M1832_003435 [Thelocarpon impressellum]|nr:MAG: hypothetical protein M1832_003435 [Thelocarpon impressellum]
MAIRTFDDWAAARAQTHPLGGLKDSVIGIEAAHYLQRLLATPPSKEPLLSALGGFPFALKSHIENELDSMQAAGITPLFVFSGLDVGPKHQPSRDEGLAARANTLAWELYDQHEPVKAVETFGDSGSVKPYSLFRFLQRILRDRKIEFMVAPYNACGQLAYLERSPAQFIDAVVGSSELLLFDVDKVITRLDFEHSQFSWLSRRTCQIELGKISGDVFIDACMLSGTSFLPTFPPLENPVLSRKPFTIRDTINMMLTVGPSVTAVCTHYQDEAQVQQMDYLDKYRRGRLAVKHHVVLTDDGKVEPLNVDLAPSDIHEFIGQRLPEELYFYLSKGVVGPRVLNWLTSGELFENPPLDSGDSEEYHKLVRDQLAPLRMQALALLSQPISRFYQRKDVTARFWFDKDLSKVLSHKDLVPSPRELVAPWNVKEGELAGQRAKIIAPPGSLTFAVESLVDQSFASRSVTPKDNSKPLVTKDEILSNTLWRFLQLRGYIDAKHSLTLWGRSLQAALSALDPADHLEEPTFLAIELVRLNLVNANDTFSTYIGAPLRGSENDKKSCLLVSRVACLGKLRHKSIGFTGPLSRNLLAHHSFISALRNSLRDLVEIVLTNLLLNGDADRNRDDWTDLGLGLPFIDDNDCGLGIAVKSYLDELAAQPDAVSTLAKAQAKAKGAEEWFPHSVDIAGDLDVAFRLWDAVHKGVKAAGAEFKDQKTWADVDGWLGERR